jgi:hypothetical protein
MALALKAEHFRNGSRLGRPAVRHEVEARLAEAKAEAKALGLTDKIEIIRIELDPVEF